MATNETDTDENDVEETTEETTEETEEGADEENEEATNQIANLTAQVEQLTTQLATMQAQIRTSANGDLSDGTDPVGATPECRADLVKAVNSAKTPAEKRVVYLKYRDKILM